MSSLNATTNEVCGVERERVRDRSAGKRREREESREKGGFQICVLAVSASQSSVGKAVGFKVATGLQEVLQRSCVLWCVFLRIGVSA